MITSEVDIFEIVHKCLNPLFSQRNLNQNNGEQLHTLYMYIIKSTRIKLIKFRLTIEI